MTLIDDFVVTTGEFSVPTIRPTRAEADFASHIEQDAATSPNTTWIFVTDNLNIQ